MSLKKVTVNGHAFIVDAPSVGTARAFGKDQLVIEVADATAGDITAFLNAGGEIKTLEARNGKSPVVATVDPSDAN